MWSEKMRPKGRWFQSTCPSLDCAVRRMRMSSVMGCRSVVVLFSVEAREHGDFLAVVVQLLGTDPHRLAALRREQVEAERGLLPALLHRQLQVEDGVAAPAVGEPLRHAARHLA